MRTLVGGIGYRHLRDHSFGVLVSDALARRAWPAEVSVEDLSYGPIAVVQRLEDEATDRALQRIVVVSAVERVGLEPGTLSVYRWDGSLPPVDSIQTAVTEAVTGVIAMDNTLIVAKHFGALPRDVVVIEVQPDAHEFGDALTDAVAQVFDRACRAATDAALDAAFATRLSTSPLGGGALRVLASHGPRISNVTTRTR